MKKQKILLIDDSQKCHDNFMQVISSVHDDLNIEVEHVLDSSQALEVALKYMPDVIFCDVLMPEPDGFALCSLFKAHEKFSLIPFVLLTISAGDKNLIHAIDAGADDYIVKSSSPELYLMKIKGITKLAKFKSETLLKIEEANAKVAESSRMANLGQMTASLAHHINNPLTIISGKLQKLLMMSKKPDTSITTITDDVEKMLVKADRISQIIGFLRLSTGVKNFEPYEKIAIKQLVDEALVQCDEYIKKCGVEVKLEIAEDLIISCHDTQIIQVFYNLINNSCDAVTKQSNKWINITAAKVENNFVKISITDSGPGIPDNIIDKLMQPFFTTKDVNLGLGLNLSTANGIISYHRGTFALDRSSANTRFVIELPLA